ncbi:MAG: non-canonical purine NTP pyrophosphatase, RdgB/HAM1 family [Candidatus Magasanikbacteria bacterium RIFCSPHIGHO2_02_FULL_51_14]|uniref:dITP/XTP pyrophosphatase n=1 Tax=Candidatus Magasanikbacteria bacterium RIFCSPHIGHO2_02_FULL_51_14 TaxID=1798683 RepID=A0A1F6MDE1_9BACT|nr:MAG: non-canonical purine NTP pyrophosphatase, RdgB/HAM1 family [Candidatus Magasanikbacteria bacterium RIFCSPHIGHO2_02_FULL_51_14]
MKLLVATTNTGKYTEICQALSTLPFIECESLKDVGFDITEPNEDEQTLEGNALLKARYYADKTGMVTLADDGGLYIDALNGWPGVMSARIANTDKGRRDAVLEKLVGVSRAKRTAVFRDALALCDRAQKTYFISIGEAHGEILEKETDEAVAGFGYDPIFYVPDAGKTYAEMTVIEKNGISHRGKALVKIKYHLHNAYGGRHIVVPLALIVKGGKILMNKRNDPHVPQFHGVWEFQGGSVEYGETIEENVRREAKEESGYEVEVAEYLPTIEVKNRQYNDMRIQLYLVPIVCRIIRGDGKYNDQEVLEAKWYALDDVPNLNLFPGDGEMYRKFLPLLKDIVKNHGL